MLDVREAIALLSPSGIDPTKPAIFGGTTITPQDVAAAMAGLEPVANHLLLVKYAADSSSCFSLRREWFRVVCRKWRQDAIDLEPIHELSEFSLEEFVHPHRCGVCKGVGTMPIGARVATCEACFGTGHVYPVGKLKEPWRGRIGWCRDKLRDIEATALIETDRRLLR